MHCLEGRHTLCLPRSHRCSVAGAAAIPPPPPVKSLTFAEYLAFVFRPLPYGVAAAQRPGAAPEDSAPMYHSRLVRTCTFGAHPSQTSLPGLAPSSSWRSPFWALKPH